MRRASRSAWWDRRQAIRRRRPNPFIIHNFKIATRWQKQLLPKNQMQNRNQSSRNRYPKIRRRWTGMKASLILRHLEETIPLNPRSSHSLATISIIWILVGLLIFLSQAQFGLRLWDNAYYLWDKSKDCLLLATIYLAIPAVRPYALLVWVLLLIRLCTEIITGICHINPNQPIIIIGLFSITLAVVLYFTSKLLFEEWKQK